MSLRISYNNFYVVSMTSIKKWETLTLADDFIFCRVLTNEEVCKALLEQMLNIKIDHLEYLQSQQTIDVTLASKGIRLDVYVKDSTRVFDIEMQKINTLDLPKRARYYQSMIDVNIIHKGESYTSLKESYVIFICLEDPFCIGLSCYHFDYTCLENPELLLNDMAHKVFYNVSSYDKEKNPEVKAFLRLLAEGKPETKLTTKMKDLVKETLHNESWRTKYMTVEMLMVEEKQAGIKIGLEQGRKAGVEEGFIETAKNMKNVNIDIATISLCTGLSIEEIEKL